MGGLLARSSREHPLERTRRRGLLGFSSVASSSAISPIQQLQDRFARWETRIRYEEKTARLAELERSLSVSGARSPCPFWFSTRPEPDEAGS